jgi:hypothetical protein
LFKGPETIFGDTVTPGSLRGSTREGTRGDGSTREEGGKRGMEGGGSYFGRKVEPKGTRGIIFFRVPETVFGEIVTH